MINPEIINRFAKGAAPRVLVVTDMSFAQGGNGFSLWQFVDTLLKAGMEVTQANLLNIGGEPEGTLLGEDGNGFKFNDPTNGLSREKYDVCFIFAFEIDKPRIFPNDPPPRQPRRQLGLPDLEDSELAAIKRFMKEGGGVFATGDHEDLGARTCKDIPRVSSMRKWYWNSLDPNNLENAPSIAGVNRLSTNLPGDDELYEFNDQSDRHLQRLYLNRRTEAGGGKNIDMPHPLMQTYPLMPLINERNERIFRPKAVVHIPDHPHEGECIIPSADKLQDRTEWPLELGGNEPVIPEIVAKSMSHGGAFPRKAPLTPREFIAIAAYDGHRAGVGRVVTDATWHHFIDINIDGTGSEFSGEHRSALMPKEDEIIPDIERQQIVIQLKRLQQHWRNLAEWLMPPQDRRRHAAAVHIADAVKSIPLDVLISLSSDLLDDLGRIIKTNLDSKLLPYQVNDLVETVLAMGISDPAQRRADNEEQRNRLELLKMVALGAVAAALANQREEDTDEVILANLAEAVKARLQQP